MAIRDSERERTPEFSRSVIFTMSDIDADDRELLVLPFIVNLCKSCKFVVTRRAATVATQMYSIDSIKLDFVVLSLQNCA